MGTSDDLVRALLLLSTSYRDGATHLSSLASRAEVLVDGLRAHLSPEDFARTRVVTTGVSCPRNFSVDTCALSLPLRCPAAVVAVR